jgi:hypothetical protein
MFKVYSAHNNVLTFCHKTITHRHIKFKKPGTHSHDHRLIVFYAVKMFCDKHLKSSETHIYT